MSADAGRDFDLVLRDAVCVTPAGRVEAGGIGFTGLV